MKSRTTMLLKIASLVAIGGGTFGPSGVVFAQEQQDENNKPKPAAHAPLIDNEDQNTTDPDALQPDTTPLTGAQSPGLGTAEFRHSYWVPGFTVANTAQSNPYGGGGTGNSSGWFDTTYLAG